MGVEVPALRTRTLFLLFIHVCWKKKLIFLLHSFHDSNRGPDNCANFLPSHVGLMQPKDWTLVAFCCYILWFQNRRESEREREKKRNTSLLCLCSRSFVQIDSVLRWDKKYTLDLNRQNIWDQSEKAKCGRRQESLPWSKAEQHATSKGGRLLSSLELAKVKVVCVAPVDFMGVSKPVFFTITCYNYHKL